MSKTVIEVRDLEKRYGTVHAVRGVSFSVEAGVTMGLLGGNGAGKTTTIAMMLGLLEPTGGSVSILGCDMATDRYRALPYMNFSSPYVDLPHRLTVRENLRIYAGLYSVPDPKARIAEMAEQLHMTEFMNRPSGKLSAGQKTRVALAKALIDGLARSRYGGLDPDLSGNLPARDPGNGPARLPQHAGSRAAVRRCADDAAGHHRRPGQPGRALGKIRAPDHG